MSLIGSLTSGVSTLNSFEKGLEVIGNNIANVNTTGFKGSSVQYQDNFYNTLQESAPADGAASNTTSKEVGTGVGVQSIYSDNQQGTLASTGSNTDMGISGNGFFTVRDPVNGTEYVTRAGNFRLDSNGYMVTQQGFRVQGLSDGSATYDATAVNGQIAYAQTATAPSTLGDLKVDFSISVGNGLTNNTGGAFTDAQVNATAPSLQSFTVDKGGNLTLSLSNGNTVVRGKVLLQSFNDPSALQQIGTNLYTNMNSAGPVGGIGLTGANNAADTNGLGVIQVGTLEQSNVDLTQQFTDLITAQRSFQAGSRIITVSDTLLEEIVNLKRS